MNYYLIEIHSNWADEMDISAYEIKSEADYKDWKNGWEKLQGDSVEVCIGTNEDMEVSYNEFEVTKITEDDYKTLKKLGLLEFGHTELIDAYDRGYEDDDWNDDDWENDWDDEDDD